MINLVNDSLIGRLTEAASDPQLLVILETGAETLRAVVEGVAEWLMNALEVGTSHEHLRWSTRQPAGEDKVMLTLSNAVEHARGCVAKKIGLVDILSQCPLKRECDGGGAGFCSAFSPKRAWGHERVLCGRNGYIGHIVNSGVLGLSPLSSHAGRPPTSLVNQQEISPRAPADWLNPRPPQQKRSSCRPNSEYPAFRDKHLILP